jgi:hypothetical protein
MDKHIKNSLPDLTSLEKKLDIVLERNLPDFLSVTQSRREEVVSNGRFVAIAFSFVIAVFVALYLIQGRYDPIVTNILMGCAVIWLFVILIAGSRYVVNDKLFAKEMSMALVPILDSLFDRTLLYTNNTTHEEESVKLLTESELITVKNINVISDDIYTVFGDREITFRELLITQSSENIKKKADSQNELFKGLFIVAKLNHQYQAKTFISTEGDRSGLAHKTFWSNLLESNDVKEVLLEWNDFEKDLHIASSDNKEVREILNPEFMQDLHDWWNEHKLNFRLSFKGDKMFLLLPEISIKLGESTTSTKLSSIKRYAQSLARPIWRGLMLVEDVPQ